MDVRPECWILNLPRKMMTCYLRDINKFLRCRTMCKSILKWGFPTKGIELTQFLLFEVLGVPQLWVSRFKTISVGSVQKFAKYKWDYGIRNFSVLDKLVRLCICSQLRVFPRADENTDENIQAVSEACTVLLRGEVIIFSWCIVVCHS